MRAGLGGRTRAALTLSALLAAAAPAQAQWSAGQGGYWAKASIFHHGTQEQYLFDGSKRPFFQPGGESRSTALFIDLLYGVADRVDLWAQLPYFDLRFNDDSGRLHDTGVSDVRLSVRYNFLRLRGGSIPISGRFTVKAPIADLPIDRDVIPVSEGQWDYEAWLEAGVSLWPAPAYGVLWLGYRWRTLNRSTTIDPGDERALLAEIGATVVGPLGAKVVLDGTFGGPTATQGVSGPNDVREIVQLQPTVTWAVTPALTLEVGPRVPLHGKNFPAGRQWVFALFHRPADR